VKEYNDASKRVFGPRWFRGLHHNQQRRAHQEGVDCVILRSRLCHSTEREFSLCRSMLFLFLACALFDWSEGLSWCKTFIESFACLVCVHWKGVHWPFVGDFEIPASSSVLAIISRAKKASASVTHYASRSSTYNSVWMPARFKAQLTTFMTSSQILGLEVQTSGSEEWDHSITW